MSSVKGRTLQTNVEQKKLVQKRLERVSVLSSENSRLFFSMFLSTFVRPIKWPMLYLFSVNIRDGTLQMSSHSCNDWERHDIRTPWPIFLQSDGLGSEKCFLLTVLIFALLGVCMYCSCVKPLLAIFFSIPYSFFCKLGHHSNISLFSFTFIDKSVRYF